MKDVEHLIALSKIVAKPWVISTWLLATLLALSVIANVYMATHGTEITIDADNNVGSNINQHKG